jgi:thiol reductant ABC exporter CydC subunit
VRAVLALVPRKQAALAVVLGAFTVLCGAALLAASGALISGAALQPETLLVLMPLITSVRLFGVSRAALRYAERIVSHDLTLRLVGRLRAELLARLIPLAPAALAGARGGDLLARIRVDVDELQGVFVRLLAPAAVAVLASTVAVTLTALVSPALALVLAALLLLLGVLVPAWARAAGRHPALEAARADAAFGSDTLDLIRGLADHATGDGGATVLRTLDAHLAEQEGAERARARLTAVTTFLREGVPALGVGAALWLVGWDVTTGATHPVLLAATALGVLGSFEAVAGLGAAWTAAENITAAAGRVHTLGEQRPVVTDPPVPLPRPADATLRFEAVTLTYPDSTRPALAGLDLHVRAGEKVALTGPSGAGKSSVIALALRARDPDAGRVTLGDADLRDLALADVRSRFAWAPQTPQILGGTLAGNVRLGRGDAADADVAAALREVGLGDLPVGLHGWIGESGERLSAGERARVAMARALLSPARILLLDEPTAHLDAPLAAHLLDLLATQPRAVLLVTHSPEVLDGRWRVVPIQAPGA